VLATGIPSQVKSPRGWDRIRGRCVALTSNRSQIARLTRRSLPSRAARIRWATSSTLARSEQSPEPPPWAGVRTLFQEGRQNAQGTPVLKGAGVSCCLLRMQRREADRFSDRLYGHVKPTAHSGRLITREGLDSAEGDRVAEKSRTCRTHGNRSVK